MKRYYTINTNIKLVEINKFKLTYTLPAASRYNEFCIELNNVLYSLDRKFNYSIEYCIFIFTNNPKHRLLPSYTGINKELDKDKIWLIRLERIEFFLSKYKRNGYYKAVEYWLPFDDIKEDGSRIEEYVEDSYKGLAREISLLIGASQKELDAGKEPTYTIDTDRAVVLLIHKKLK